ncbi:ABC-type transport system, involved in lipoprotein release, permease component [Streptosporangium subroseum]|uniref:ABC-type transport system, involved in lipoprotein release, permease component n=1 Tax=Streptosporangium subroseum TaxID=106412 RepID=A0A239LBH1_9ACTN|nr:FtsX-like permease family protein [Streptosporangium subroseum]SNT27183.1 ABC-type transport system, involved in lipoprotein release, permease component [Streptosporangium subroseum]
MIVTVTWFRLELRRRWRSLVVLALLVAFATATVLASVAGARRGGTAVDRLAALTLPATVAVLPNEPGFDWAGIRALPQVEALTEFPVSGFGVDGISNSEEVSAFPPVDDELLRTIERPVVLEGRLPDPTRIDEVVVSSRFPATYHRGVGDRLTLRLMSVEQAGSDDFDPSGSDPLLGPSVPVTIVGVIRSTWFAEKLGDRGGVLPSAALFARYHANIVGPKGYINALVRLKGGEAAIPAFREGLVRASKRSDIDMWNIEMKIIAPSRQVAHFEAASLLAFGLAALAAAIVLIGQSVARYTAATMADLQVLRAVGLTPRQAVVAASAGPFLAALAGTTLGIVSAAAASTWMPIGAAALLEPHPGFDVDWLILGTGWALILALVLAGSAASAALALVATRGRISGRRSGVALAAARAGLPVPIVIGARFALEPGRGKSAVPVRPALVGAIAGVVGVLAAFTFSAGVRDATENPARFGQTHQLEIFLGFNNEDFVPSYRQMLETVARDPAVQAVNDARIAVAEAEVPATRTATGAGAEKSRSAPVTVYTYDPVGGPLPVVLFEGRMPATPEEIVLGPSSADALGVAVGGRVPMGGGPTPVPMTVTGIGFMPEGPHNGYADGGWVIPAGYDRLFAGAHFAFKFHGAEIALRPGTDLAAVKRRLESATAPPGGGGLPFTDPLPLPQVAQIRDVQSLPVLLAGFLALLAVGAVGHALATTVRRRRHEVAVLRALGMTRPQARWMVVTQATLLAVVGLLFGVPLGVAFGRTLWRIVADIAPLVYVPPLALWALLLAGPVTLLLANLLAAWPGSVATRLRIGHVLRTE